MSSYEQKALYPYKGRKLTFAELCELPELAVSTTVLRSRLIRGMPVSKAVTMPKQDGRHGASNNSLFRQFKIGKGR